MKNHLMAVLALTLLATGNSPWSAAFAQGGLTPPGAPAPTMKSLDQIEARTPITSLPFTITTMGAYYLTGNLTYANNSKAIIIRTNDVTIDLNGFTLFGPVQAGGVGLGSVAIAVPNSQQNITVRNGNLDSWGTAVVATNVVGAKFYHLQCYDILNAGLTLGDNGVVEDCTIFAAGEGYGSGNGIQAGNGSVVAHCSVDGSTGSGIQVGHGCVIDGCTCFSGDSGATVGDGTTVKGSSFSGGYGTGLQAGNGCTITGCTAENNEDGIVTGIGATIKECTIFSNALVGLSTGNGCTIADCTANFNDNGITAASECSIIGCTASGNSVDGIQAAYSCLIKGNTCSSNSRTVANGGAGIHTLNDGNRIEENVLNSNQYGIKVDGGETLVIKNAVRQAIVTNYKIAANNQVATIVFGTESGAISGFTGGASLGTTDPWANFSY